MIDKIDYSTKGTEELAGVLKSINLTINPSTGVPLPQAQINSIQLHKIEIDGILIEREQVAAKGLGNG